MNTTTRLVRALSAGLAAMLCLTACSSEQAEEGAADTWAAVRAEPSVGIGREFGGDSVPVHTTPADPTGYTILVDPGHGFVDGGTGENVFEDGILEKDVTLAIATLLVEDLEFLGFETILSHDGEHIPEADVNKNNIFNAAERADYANTLDIDYFVSIHVNAIDDTTVYGSQIYYEQNGNKVNAWSQPIAEAIAERLTEAYPNYKAPKIWHSEKDKTLEVTRETRAAASLIEVGFCTNETDRNNMVDPNWQAVFAQAIADGINDFFMSAD